MAYTLRLVLFCLTFAVPVSAGNRSQKTPIPPLPAPAVTVKAPAVALPGAAPTVSQPVSLGTPAAAVASVVGAQGAALMQGLAADPAGQEAGQSLDTLYLGPNKTGSDAVAADAVPPAPGFVLSDEGVWVMDRAARYLQETRRLAAKLAPHMDVRETLDVFDDTIGEVRSKLVAVEAIARQREVSQPNTHLEKTLTWVDGVLLDGRRTIGVHTHRVFFHPAKNPRSEIEEGLRRVDGYLRDAERHFMRGGEAERNLELRLDEVVLAFDARGYAEIKDHLLLAEKRFQQKHPGRFRFVFVDELAPTPKTNAEMRAEYNRLIEKYKHDPEGLQKIIEGVMYSRYVGVLLELKTMEYKQARGYTILQSGRDLFDKNGKYVTEGDTVVRSPKGEVEWIEAKSARVGLPFQEVMRNKVLYKLDIYKKNQALMEKTIGGPLSVVFSFDPGGRDAQAAALGILVWKYPEQRELMEKLQQQAPLLSQQYGFPVSFLFLNSQPNEDPLLFYKNPQDAGAWYSQQRKAKKRR